MRNEHTQSIDNMEKILLFVYAMAIGCFMFGDKHSRLMYLTGNMGWSLAGAGIFVLAGYRAFLYVQGRLTRREILQYALWYYGLYVLTGFGRFVILDQGDVWDDLIRVAMFISVPKFAEVFFTATMLFLLMAVGKPVIKALADRRWLTMLLAIAGFLLVFVPQNAVRFPILTLWIGGDCYRCLAILTYLGYALAGWYMAGEHRKLPQTAAACISVVYTLILVFWHRSALVKKMEFPVKYWVVLLPAGLLVLLVLLLSQKKVAVVYESVRKKLHGTEKKGYVYLETAILLLFLHLVRGVLQVKKCSSLRTVFICLLCWLISIACARMVVVLRRDGVRAVFGRHKKICFFILYTVGFVGVFCLVYLQFLEHGVSLIWRRDAISQYFPKAIYFSKYIRETLHDLLQGDFVLRMYDFSMGMGDSVPVKLEPLYWLHALFAPDDMETGYEVVMILRMYLSGLSVSAMLLYFKKNWKITWICSYIYCFSGYAVYACTRHAQFMVPFILLPMLVIAVEQILRKKKWYFGCIMIAVSMLCSYYFLYMNTIALFVYFLVRYAFMPKEHKSFKAFWSYIGCFAIAYILGIGMGSMTIFTSLFNYFGSDRAGSGNVQAASLLYYKKDWLHDVYMAFVTPNEGLGYWVNLGFVAICFFAVILLFLRKGKKELKICISVCLIGLAFPFFAYFMSGFGNVTNRWLYILALLVTVAVAETFSWLPSLTVREVKILGLALLPGICMSLFYSRYADSVYQKSLVLLLLTYLVIVLSMDKVAIIGSKQAKAALGLLILAGLALQGDMLFGANGADLVEEYALKGEAVSETEHTAIKGCTAIEDDSFYRVTEAETDTYNYCASAALGLKSVSYFNSTMNGLILEFDRLLGNGRSSKVYQSDLNNRTMLNALAAVKYYGAYDDEHAEYMLPYGYTKVQEPVVDGESYIVYGTEATLPLAYSYENVMTMSEFLAQPLEERQEILLKNAVVEDTEELSGTYAASDTKVTGFEIQPKEILLEDTTWEENCVTGEPDGTVTFTVDPVPNSELYFVFKGTTVPLQEGRDTTLLKVICENGRYEYRIRPEENIYYMEFEKYMLNTGYSKEGLDSFTIQFLGKGQLNLDDWMIWCQPMDTYEQDLQALTKDSLENISVEKNTIHGTISAEQDKMLTFSVPYQKGWTAYVDGEKQPLHKVNIMYTGLEITAGEHDIVLTYEMPGVRYGVVVTVGSAGLFILIIAVSAVIKRRKKGRMAQK